MRAVASSGTAIADSEETVLIPHPVDCGLSAGETLQVSHLALHFLAGDVGGGPDALDARFEFVGVGSARQSLVDGDQLLGVQIEERWVEGVHAVLAGSGGRGA